MTGRPAYVRECESPCWFVLRLRQSHMELHISASSFLALSRPQ
ncbi:rCG47233 [Rattus norvegicus]|uniref:RCG47233 n=1 Tax=Rattus norvegicus TaxID=10116 RepID=A6HZA4_RAT|nr:rCG47233 [Rattus norvegicus]